MKKIILFWALPLIVSAQSTALFKEDQICSIFIQIHPDSFQLILDEKINERYLEATFIFDDGTFRDTLPSVGFRLRGNTSLGAAKKSFKISFNEFVDGRSYQGVRKLNLRGQANDPTLIREKVFYEIWRNAGMPERRAVFAKLYVNGAYRGLYTNIEELDKKWLDRVFNQDEGNLYKCLWPADLVWLGANPEVYKNVMHSPGERAYRLVTNEATDDYTRFAALVEAINQPNSSNYTSNLNQILNVTGVLKAYAIDIATGNWDDYFYLKNNYYLYDNPQTGRFEFITYDTDNSMGVDWLNKDWAHRNCLDWENHSEARPLATKLLEVPELKQQFIFYLDSITRHITCPDIIFPRIDALHAFITDDAEADPFRPLDFGYSINDFHASFDQSSDNHTPYGLKPFLLERCQSTLAQIEGLISAVEQPENPKPDWSLFPNPAGRILQVESTWKTGPKRWEILSAQGMLVADGQTDAEKFQMETELLPGGVYVFKLTSEHKTSSRIFIKE
ncbi:MAG: CotH kinase family protein [Saprospiraceae bacterium]|nr:CotH kinase family protein [Saprospiraceae bacterium]